MLRWSNEEETRLLTLVLSGQLNINQIAKLLDKTVDSVRKKMKAKNIRIVGNNLESRYDIINDYKNKVPLLDIAQRHRSSIEQVKNVLFWGQENGIVSIRKDILSKWKEGDIIKLTRLASLADDNTIYRMFNRQCDIAKIIKSFWGVGLEYIVGIEISDFAEMYNLSEDDKFPIIITTIDRMVEDKNGEMIKEELKVVPWVFVEEFDAKSRELDFAANKMASLQRMIYLETDKNKILEKIMKIIGNKYDEKDYYMMQ